MARRPLRYRIRRLLQLGPRDWAALVRALGSLVGARAALLLLPLRSVLEFASRTPSHRLGERPRKSPTDATGAGGPDGEDPEDPPPPQATHADPDLERMIWAVDVVGRRLFPQNPCLTQAVVVQRLLRRRGIPAELRIGVRKEQGATLEAHAWVEHEGEVVMGGRGLAEDHVPFPSILSPPTPPSPRRDGEENRPR